MREMIADLTFQAQLNRLNWQMLPHEQVGIKNFYKLRNNRKFKPQLLSIYAAKLKTALLKTRALRTANDS